MVQSVLTSTKAITSRFTVIRHKSGVFEVRFDFVELEITNEYDQRQAQEYQMSNAIQVAA